MSGATATDPFVLGRLTRECKLSKARLRLLLILMAVSAALASMFILPAVFERHASLAARIVASVVGLFCALPLFVGIQQLLRLRGVSLRLYENGLMFRRRGHQSMATWDEIDSYIREGAVRITKKNGEVIEFGLGVEGVEEAADEIEEQILQRMLPQIKAAIESGASVQFKGLKPLKAGFLGKALSNVAFARAGFSVDEQGITELDGGNRIAWKDVQEYGIRQEKMGRVPVDVFFIQDGNSSFWTRYGLLSNAHVLLALCAEMTGRDPMEGG